MRYGTPGGHLLPGFCNLWSLIAQPSRETHHTGNWTLVSIPQTVYDVLIKYSFSHFLFWWCNQVMILNMSWQLSCCDLCKIVTWSNEYFSCEHNGYFHKIWIMNSLIICEMSVWCKDCSSLQLLWLKTICALIINICLILCCKLCFAIVETLKKVILSSYYSHNITAMCWQFWYRDIKKIVIQMHIFLFDFISWNHKPVSKWACGLQHCMIKYVIMF